MKTQVELMAARTMRLSEEVDAMPGEAELVDMTPKHVKQLGREYDTQYSLSWIGLAEVGLYQKAKHGKASSKEFIAWFERTHPSRKLDWLKMLMRMHKCYVGTPLQTLPESVLSRLLPTGEAGTNAAIAALREGTPVTLQWVSEWRALPGNRKQTTVKQCAGKMRVIAEQALRNEDCTEEQRQYMEIALEAVEVVRNL